MRLRNLVILAALAFLACFRLVHAQAAPPVPSPPAGLIGVDGKVSIPLLVAFFCTVAAFFVRTRASRVTWIHDHVGTGLLVGLSALLTAVSEAIMSKGLSLNTALMAVIGATPTFFALLDGTQPKNAEATDGKLAPPDDAPPSPPIQKAA